MPAYAACIACPGFSLGVYADDHQVTGIEFLPAQAAFVADTPLAHEIQRQFHAWLHDPQFQFTLPLAPAGTPFRQRVWQAMRDIPCGQTRSYGEISKRLQSAPRAVGGACGANPYPVVVPCHRIVAARSGFNQGLGGFAHQREGFLLDIKRWLLNRERMAVAPECWFDGGA